jgi:hypothetical protein
MWPTILAGVALGAAAGAAKAGSLLTAVEHAAEVPLAGIVLPGVEAGSVAFAVCDGCEVRSVALSRGTRYLVNNRTATFEAFVAAVQAARAAAEVANRSLVGLYFDAASKRLVRLALVAPLPSP